MKWGVIKKNLKDDEILYGSQRDNEIFENCQPEKYYPTFQVLATSIKNYFNPKNLLDVGCAKGFLVKTFSDIGIEARGIDISEYAISEAPEDIRYKLHKVDLNYDKLPFKEEQFDFITFLGTIQYIKNHEYAISEVKRVLRDGGALYLANVRLTGITTEEMNKKGFLVKEDIHNREYWIKKFQSQGFRFAKKELIDFTINGLLNQMFDIQNKESIKFKVGKTIYQKGGYIGKRVAYFVHKISNLDYNKDYGEFLFTQLYPCL